jgi:hypothetical protein
VRQVAANASIKLARSHTSYVGYAIGGVVPRLIGDVEVEIIIYCGASSKVQCFDRMLL